MIFAGFYDNFLPRLQYDISFVWNYARGSKNPVYTGLLQLVQYDVRWGVFYWEVK